MTTLAPTGRGDAGGSCVKVAIAHDYLTQRGGAERVVLSMLKAFPNAVLYTLLYDPASTFGEFSDHRVVTSPLNAVGIFRRNHRSALPLLPAAARAMRVDADIVLASTSGWAHGFDVGSAALVAYCHSPARWLYQTERYLGPRAPVLRRLGLKALRTPLIEWDRRSARRVDRYLANSTVVQDRIREAYGRASTILPAPLTLCHGAQVRPSQLAAFTEGGPFYLCVSRLLPYKNVRQVVDGCQLAGVNLVVVGQGPELGALKASAGSTTQILTDITDGEMSWLYAHCVAVVAASYEDFGLTPIEGAAHGKPTVALRFGGYLDTILEDRTGVFFNSPTAEAIAEAIRRSKDLPWSVAAIRSRAEEYSEDGFVARLTAEIDSVRCRRGVLSRR